MKEWRGCMKGMNGTQHKTTPVADSTETMSRSGDVMPPPSYVTHGQLARMWHRLAATTPARVVMSRALLVLLFTLCGATIFLVFQTAVKVGKLQVTVLAQSSICKDCVTGSFSDRPFPRILHHTWKTNVIPDKWKNSSQSCRDINTDYEYMLWTDVDIENLIRTEYPWFLATYRGYTYNIQRADAGRYFILYHYGGVYTDLDIQCRYTFQHVLHNVTRYDIVFPQGLPIGVTAEVMFAKPRHPYLELAIHSLEAADQWRLVPYLTIMMSTGPLFLSTCLMKYPHPEQVYIIPSEQYTKDLFINLHGGSWHEWDGDIIFWVYCHKLVIVLCLAALITAAVVVYKCRARIPLTKNGLKATVKGYAFKSPA